VAFYWLICGGPEPGAPIEEWEAYLQELLSEPDQDDEGVAGTIRMVRFEIALRKGEVDDDGNIVPPASGQ
jgi:hypothetical protein